MKKSILSTILLSTASLYATTTMCYKENHTSMSTIENTKLNGGECQNLYSLKDMKEKGWRVEDIKITTKNSTYDFIYILKKGTSNSNSFNTSSSNLSQEELEKKIIKRMEEKKKREEKEKEIKRKLVAKKHGKEIYEKKCASCHGAKGEKKAYGTSKPLNTLSLKYMKYAIGQYTNKYDYGNGKQLLMRPYASNTSSKEITEIYEYLQSIK